MPGINPVKIFESDVNQVAAGSKRGGWVSGSPANLAAVTGLNVIFDLGDDWDQYPIVCVYASNTGPGTPMQILLRTSDNPLTFTVARALRDLQDTARRPIADLVSSANVVGVYHVYNCGRYLLVQVSNQDAVNPLSATAKVVVSMQPIGG